MHSGVAILVSTITNYDGQIVLSKEDERFGFGPAKVCQFQRLGSKTRGVLIDARQFRRCGVVIGPWSTASRTPPEARESSPSCFLSSQSHLNLDSPFFPWFFWYLCDLLTFLCGNAERDSATSSWPERDSSDEAADTTNSAFHLLPSTSVPLTKQTHDSPKFHHAWRECLNLPTTHSRIIFPYQRQSPLSTLDVFTDEPVASHAVGSAFTSVENILESSLTPTLHHRTCRTTVICRP